MGLRGPVTELAERVGAPAAHRAVVEEARAAAVAAERELLHPDEARHRRGRRAGLGRPVHELVSAVVAPARDGVVAEASARVDRAGADLEGGRHVHERGDARVVVGAVAELPVIVGAPALHVTVVEDDARMLGARGDPDDRDGGEDRLMRGALPALVGADASHRLRLDERRAGEAPLPRSAAHRELRGDSAKAFGLDGVDDAVAPAAHAVSGERAGSIAARRDGGDARERRTLGDDRQGGRAERAREPGAKLSARAVAPAANAAARERAGVSRADGEVLDLARVARVACVACVADVEDRRRQRARGGGAVAELPGIVAAPAFEVAGLLQTARM